MKRECAWCGQDLGNSSHLDDKGVTHGICLSCSEKMVAESRLAFVRENFFQDNEMAELPAYAEPHFSLVGSDQAASENIMLS
jgi:hypothetical protein